jgi:DNA-binding XRE family transcriptional regulator
MRVVLIDLIGQRDTSRSDGAKRQYFWINDIPMAQILGRQISAARALIGMTQGDLATRANISVPTLKRMEASAGPASGMANNVAAVQRALEEAGVEFIPENGGGAGVRLRAKIL